ncbi:uncharacterized protein LOC128606451 [Ictalurus furcatus]|uniref:uncharacterized protein LOC128606451 n=1 Tax=Ictalurus furcatus TaxID=66913 RepID=UPI002350D1B1|nr:uncharacterized protein LOC128606451 [Ictalurus furcatus]XP_053478558.1 uncharacterized protein LOC128606451 [Ictalurus furcatus]
MAVFHRLQLLLTFTCRTDSSGPSNSLENLLTTLEPPVNSLQPGHHRNGSALGGIPSLRQILQGIMEGRYFRNSPTHNWHSTGPDDPARISACLSDISVGMREHHLKLNLSKSELLIIPACPAINHNLTVQLGSTTLKPTRTARNLGVILDDSLTFTDHISTTARSCRFILYNIKKIRPYLTEQATQILVQALVISKLDYCNSLLSGLPASSIKPLQMIQNAAAHLVFNQPKRTHVAPLFISLQWLPVASRIKFKALMLTFKTLSETAPSYLNSLLKTYVPSRNLRSINDRRLVVPTQRGSRSLSRTFKLTVPQWWNELPTSIRTTESLPIFKKQLKTHLFREHLTNP